MSIKLHKKLLEKLKSIDKVLINFTIRYFKSVAQKILYYFLIRITITQTIKKSIIDTSKGLKRKRY